MGLRVVSTQESGSKKEAGVVKRAKLRQHVMANSEGGPRMGRCIVPTVHFPQKHASLGSCCWATMHLVD